MFNLLPITDNSVTIRLRFSLLKISAIILSNAIDILESLPGFYF